ncbi:hypothetical protein OHV10_00065 [Vibrio splendidus]|uniref:NfrA family protein n=1 Tax=Vibrio splendidus TaxID=29497 RepID=UPI002235E008|nr:hypothetical protein [Vibrio splendidus]MCW4442657.1 hypothetical protein [Vibrio splendidus]
MKLVKVVVFKKLLFIALFVFCSSAFAESASKDIFEGMSESDHFRTFPYVDKAYQYESEGNYSAALKELQHARSLVPKHPQFMRFAYQLGVKAGVHDSELEAFVAQLPDEERSTLLLNLRTTRSEQAELFSPYEFRVLSEGLTTQDTKTWFVRHLYSIEKKHGKKRALKWSDSQSSRYKTNQVYRFEAYAWFDEKQYQKVIPLLHKIEKSGSTSLQDDQYLILSYLHLGNSEKAEQVVGTANSVQIEAFYLRASSNILVNQNKLSQAKTELTKLSGIAELTADETNQLAYINSLSKEQLAMVRTQGVVFSQCLKNVIANHKQGDKKGVRTLFSKCDPLSSPIAWLNVAQQIEAYSILESYQFKRSDLEIKRRQALTDHYIDESDWVSLVKLHKPSQKENDRKILANAYSELEQYEHASKEWLNLYQRNPQIRYLDLSAYNSSLAEDYEQAADIYHMAITEHPEEIAKDVDLLTRASAIVFRDVSLYSISDVSFLANFELPHSIIEPSVWYAQNQCKQIVTESELPDSSFVKKAEAFCLSSSEPLLAVSKYLTSTSNPSVEDNLIMAQWSYQGGDYLSASDYWGRVDEMSLSEFDKFSYVDSLRAALNYEKADEKWHKFAVASDSEWWRLGIQISDERGDRELSKYRTTEALEKTHSPFFVRSLALRYLEAENTQSLSELCDYVLSIDTQGDMSAELGYLAAQVKPVKSELLLENANRWSPYDSDTSLIAQLAFTSSENGNKAKAQSIYRHAIEEVDMSDETLEFMQTSHRDLSYGWKFTVAGWVGESNGSIAPGFSSGTGDFFLYEDAKYYFDQPLLPGLAVSIAGLHSGQYDSNTDKWSTDEIDFGVQVQPFSDWSYFLKLGVKQGLNSDNDDTKPYIRISADAFSNDDWTSAWQRDKDDWLYHKLYLDGLYFIDEDDDYSLYVRYDLGRVFKMYEENRQRLITYGFSQWGNSQNNDVKYEDTRAGIGAAWAWEWSEDVYDGLSIYSEVGLEWQHIIENTNYHGGADAFILRFAAYF